jgi:L-fuconolactonase
MRVVDAQVHLHPGESVSSLIEAMDTAQVDAALIVHQSVVGPDNRRLIEAAESAADRLAVIAGVDPSARGFEDTVGELSSVDVVVGMRIVIHTPAGLGTLNLAPEIRERLLREAWYWEAGRYQAFLEAMVAAGLPLCIYAPGRSADIAAVADRYPSLRIVVDHANLSRPGEGGPRSKKLSMEVAEVLSLASRANVFVKASGLPAQSRAGYPYVDLRSHFLAILDAFGPDRLMWGSDFTALRGRCTYQQCVQYLGAWKYLSTSYESPLFSETAQEVFGLQRWCSSLARNGSPSSRGGKQL